MKRFNATIFTMLAIGLLCGFTNNGFAQKKKKKKKVVTTAKIEGTYWALYEMDGKSVTTPADQREAYIKLNEKKTKLEGYSGCNIITGSYDLGKEDGLSFDAGSTERACSDMSVENYVMNALNNANRYKVNGLHLLLFKGTYLLAIFEARFYDE